MKRVVQMGITLAGLLASINGKAVDITAEVRAGAAATYDLEGGSVNAGYALSVAFDGICIGDAYRLVMTPSKNGGEMKVYYTIADTFRPNDEFIVESFTFRRSPQTYDYDRSPTRIRLEGSANGVDWVLLAENADAFPLVNNKSGSAISSDDVEHLEYVVNVPHIRQANYRKYRFTTLSYTVSTANPVVIQELFLNGRIVPSRSANPELTWNGGRAGGTWDATTKNWLTSGGEETAWIPGARASIDADVLTVDGTVSVGALRFPDGSAPMISGGTLQMAYPGEIDVSHADLQISSDIVAVDFAGEDTVSSCAQGERDTTYTMLPRSDDNTKTGKEVLWWKNRRLSEVSGALSAKVLYSGSWKANPFEATSFVNDGTQASCWFWQYYSQKDAGATYAWLVAKVRFRQEGDDIYARLDRGGYVWLSTATYGTDGSQINFDGVTVTAGVVLDDAHPTGSGTTIGVKDVLLKTEIPSCGLCVDNRSAVLRLVDGRLPQDSGNNKTGATVDYFKNMRLEDISGFSDAKVHYGNQDGVGAVPCRVVKGSDAVTVQFQRLNGTSVIGVKVEFRQNGPNVSARAVYARYASNASVGCDLDGMKNDQLIAQVYDGSGYNVSGIVPILAKRSVVLSGDVSVEGKIEAHSLDLNLAGERVALPNVSGSGTIVLAPASGVEQTVSVNEAGTVVPQAAVVGATSLAFGEGGTLTFEALDLSQATAVKVPATLGEDVLRVGTTSYLTRGELRLFAPSGKCARQDADGYLSLEDAPGLGIFIR